MNLYACDDIPDAIEEFLDVYDIIIRVCAVTS